MFLTYLQHTSRRWGLRQTAESPKQKKEKTKSEKGWSVLFRRGVRGGEKGFLTYLKFHLVGNTANLTAGETGTSGSRSRGGSGLFAVVVDAASSRGNYGHRRGGRARSGVTGEIDRQTECRDVCECENQVVMEDK